ncbi:MAG: DUF4437 domain-containing protein [Alphaproteobacteria bacterium]|nr:DUF4437 domain-containing protein [Alphaproteobacteria bacterium]
MARPHLEFIPAQVVPWQRGLAGGARPEVETRILSLDETNGATSVIIRYPAGFARNAAEHLAADEEFLVLDGAIEINGQVHGRQCYGFFPAGFVRHSVFVPSGAVVLTFFSAEPVSHDGTPADGLYRPERLVRFLDTRRMAGDEKAREKLFPGIKTSGPLHKRLKTDPVTNEITWLVAIRGGWAMTQTEIHPCVEEEYALTGELVGPHGTMRPGSYFWRPPGIEHGPFATLTGCLRLVRGVGGKYTATLADAPDPPRFDVPYRPILPPAYRDYVRSYRDSETNY